jgi:hypothetical protein
MSVDLLECGESSPLLDFGIGIAFLNVLKSQSGEDSPHSQNPKAAVIAVR